MKFKIKKLVSVLEEQINYFFGGAIFKLDDNPVNESGKNIICKEITLDKKKYYFSLARESVSFTRYEIDIFYQIPKALSILYKGFADSIYQGHIRSAIISSLLDISISRFFREDRYDILWQVQNLFNALKKLSFERYEGDPATTGVFVTKKDLEEFHEYAFSKNFEIIKLKNEYEVDGSLFEGPLSYRYINGINSFYLARIDRERPKIKIINILQKTNNALSAVDRLCNYGLFEMIAESNNENFAIILNSKSEIEVLFGERRVLLWRKGKWSIFDPDIFREFLENDLSDEDKDAIIWTIYALSKIRHGTLLLIGSFNNKNIDHLKKGSVAGQHSLSQELIGKIRKKSIKELKENGDLLKILSSDGLTIVDTDGNILDTGVITDTSKITRTDFMGGGRTTAAIAASNFGKVIKVSEDGPIELYVKEQRIYRFG